jgi:hypothetical protein
MNNDFFQNIFDILQPALPNDWKKMVLFVGYTSGSYTMKYYTQNDKGVYTDCFSQKRINKAQLIKLFMSIDKIVSPERKKLDEKNRWSVLTMTVANDGTMKTEFDYSDISENAIAYEQSWKAKYIK